jgi:hypothetical protein
MADLAMKRAAREVREILGWPLTLLGVLVTAMVAGCGYLLVVHGA